MIETVVVGFVAFIGGYVARKLMEKRHPKEVAALDAKAKYYGEQAKDKLEDLKK